MPLRFGFEYGRPRLASGGPHAPAWTASIRLGWSVHPHASAALTASVLDFEVRERLEPPGSGVFSVIHEEGRAHGLTLNLVRELTRSGGLRVRAGGGAVRSTIDRTIVNDRGLGEPLPGFESAWGVQLGAGVDAGWVVPGTNGLHTGFQARFDRVFASVLGPYTVLVLSAGFWN